MRPILLTGAAVVVAVALGVVAVYARREPAPTVDGRPITTTITVAAAAPGGAVPAPATLDQVGRTIEARAKAAGLADVRVVVDRPRTIVVSSASADGDRLRSLVARGELRLRMVLDSAPAAALEPDAASSPAAAATAGPGPGATPSGTPGGKLSAVIAKLGPAYQVAQQIQDPTQLDDQTVTLLDPFSLLTPDEVAVLPPAIQFNVPTVSCAQLDRRPTGAIDAVDQQAVACELSDTASIKYLMDRATVVGEDVAGATADNRQNAGWEVTIEFTSGGQARWTRLTAEASRDGAQRQVAVVLDNVVVTAPAIQQTIPGDAVIAADFTQEQAKTMASLLQSGALPLTLSVVSIEKIRTGK